MTFALGLGVVWQGSLETLLWAGEGGNGGWRLMSSHFHFPRPQMEMRSQKTRRLEGGCGRGMGWGMGGLL